MSEKDRNTTNNLNQTQNRQKTTVEPNGSRQEREINKNKPRIDKPMETRHTYAVEQMQCHPAR